MQCRDPFRLATAIGVGENDARSTAATLLTLGLVGDDDVLAGDVLAAGLAMMFRLRSGLRGSQSRMARPTPSQPLREQAKICAGPRPSQGISNIGRSTRSQPGRFTTPRHHHDDARRTTGVTGVFLEAPRSNSLPARPIYHPATERGERLESREFAVRRTARTEGVLLVISRSTAHIAVACSFHSAEDQAFPHAAGTAPQIGKPDSC